MLKNVKLLFSLCLLLGLGLTVQAQEETAASAASVYNDALATLKEKNYVEALALFEQALELADSTQEVDQKVISLATKNGSICAYRAGSTLRKEGDLEGAVGAFERGIGLNPDNATNYLGKAQCLEDMEGKTAESVLAYIAAGEQAAASSDNKDKAPKLFEKAQNFSALAFIKQEDYDQTIQLADVYLSAREAAGDGYIAAYYKAAALNRLDRNEEALPMIQMSVGALPEGEEQDKYHLLHGMVQQALGNNDEAIAAYELVTGEKYKAAAESRINALKQ